MTDRDTRTVMDAVLLATLFDPHRRTLVVTNDGDQAAAFATGLCQILTDQGIPHRGDRWRIWIRRPQTGDPSVIVAPKGGPLYGARVDAVVVRADDIDPEWWERAVMTRLAAGGHVVRHPQVTR